MRGVLILMLHKSDYSIMKEIEDSPDGSAPVAQMDWDVYHRLSKEGLLNSFYRPMDWDADSPTVVYVKLTKIGEDELSIYEEANRRNQQIQDEHNSLKHDVSSNRLHSRINSCVVIIALCVSILVGWDKICTFFATIIEFVLNLFR